MKRIGLILFILLAALQSHAQQRHLDSLVQLERTYLREDSVRAKLLTDIARRYSAINPEIGILYAEKGIQLGEKLPDKKFLAGAFSAMGTNRLSQRDYPAALSYYQKALEINERIGNFMRGISTSCEMSVAIAPIVMAGPVY